MQVDTSLSQKQPLITMLTSLNVDSITAAGSITAAS